MTAVVSLKIRKAVAAAAEQWGRPEGEPRFGRAELVGRLVELSGGHGSATLTAAVGLVREAQGQGEPAVWITPVTSSFFPPDVAANGVRLEQLPIVRVPDAASALRAADPVLRTGAFGLVIVDLADHGASEVRVPAPLLGRLQGLAQKHECPLVLLTRKGRDVASVSSLVSLRAEATWRRTPEGFVCAVHVIKDKRRGPGWSQEESCRGAVGMR